MKLRIEAITMRTGHKVGIQPGNNIRIHSSSSTWIVRGFDEHTCGIEATKDAIIISPTKGEEPLHRTRDPSHVNMGLQVEWGSNKPELNHLE